jgi:hypothetical protein
VFLHGLGPAFLVDVWNPSLPVLPYALLLFLCWGVALRERGSLPMAVAVATFCVHEHVGYVVVAGAPLLVAVLIAFRATWKGPKEERRERLRPWFGSAMVALLVGLVLWAPPIYEEIEGNPGNLILLGAYFNDTNGEQPAGLEAGWERQSMALGLHPTWATGEPPATLNFRHGWRSTPDPPVTLLLLAAGLFLAVRRRDREGIIGGSIAAVGVLTGTIAATRITGFMYFYLTRWSMALGWFATLVGLWLIVSALVEWRPSARRATVSAASAILVVMALLLTSNVVHQRNPQDPWGPIAHELAIQVRDNLPPGRRPVQFVMNNDYQAMAHRSSLVTALERVGIDTYVDNKNPVTHGEWRTGFVDDPRITLILATDFQIEDHEDAGFKRIAEVSPLSSAELRENERYFDDLEERLEEGDDFPSWEQLDDDAIRHEVHNIAVFQVPDVPGT